MNEITQYAQYLGRMGGQAIAKRGSAHFAELGRRGMAKRWAAYRLKKSLQKQQSPKV